MTSSGPLSFTLRGVGFGYRRNQPVLENLDLTLASSVFHALIGPNGAGKSTLLRLLSGRLRPHFGTVELGGAPLREQTQLEIASTIAVVPQGEPVTFDFTVREVVLMGRYPYRTGVFGGESRKDLHALKECLEQTDLSHFSERSMGSLSGGERQRVLVARALAQEPKVLLLDEPTSAMDPKHQKQLFELLLRLNRERGMTLVLVSHDLSLVGTFADRVHVLTEGRISAEGSAADIIRPEMLSRVYDTEMGVERDNRGTVHVGLLR